MMLTTLLTVLSIVFFPITILVKLVQLVIRIFAGTINLVDAVFARIPGVLAVLVISALIVAGFRFWEKLKSQKEGGSDVEEEPFTSFYQQQK